MEEITIVRRRSRVAAILIALLVVAVIVLVALYFIGTGGVINIGAHGGADPLISTGGFHGIA